MREAMEAPTRAGRERRRIARQVQVDLRIPSADTPRNRRGIQRARTPLSSLTCPCRPSGGISYEALSTPGAAPPIMPVSM
jgi:hypothetical protein